MRNKQSPLWVSLQAKLSQLSPLAILNRGYAIVTSEDGHVYYVPYDYCLHRRDSRCNAKPGEDFPANGARVLPVT